MQYMRSAGCNSLLVAFLWPLLPAYVWLARPVALAAKCGCVRPLGPCIKDVSREGGEELLKFWSEEGRLLRFGTPKREGGVQSTENFMNVLYGWSLSRRPWLACIPPALPPSILLIHTDTYMLVAFCWSWSPPPKPSKGIAPAGWSSPTTQLERDGNGTGRESSLASMIQKSDLR